MRTATRGNPVDRRTRRTRSALRDALLSLMTETSWDDIDVLGVCRRADVARSTFYLHYANKDELLQGGLRDLQAQLHAELGPARKGRPAAWSGFRFATGLMEHVAQNRAIFRAIIGRRSGFVVQQRFREMMQRLIRRELPGSALALLPPEASVRFLASALAELLAWWVEQRPALPSEHVAAAFNAAATAMLAPPVR